MQYYFLKSSLTIVLAAIFCLFATPKLSAEESCEPSDTPIVECCDSSVRFMIGPEVYNVSRRREGGTRQNGCLAGGRLLLDYQRRFCIYWGIEGSYAVGSLTGHNSKDKKIKSKMKDGTIEARIGYAFQTKGAAKITLVPFIGAGYLWEQNNYCHPTVIPLHVMTKYWYGTFGILTSANFGCSFNIGFNVKVRALLNPRCQTSNDPEFSSSTLKIGNDELAYRLELPIIYRCNPEWFRVALVPFYERREYGKQAGYPFDYFKTTIVECGASLMIVFDF